MKREQETFPYIAHLLNGAEVEWKPLGEVCEFSNTGVDKKTIEGEKKVKLLNFVDVFHKQYITKETPTMIVSASDKKILDCNILKGDVFITPSSEILDEIGYSATAIEDIEGAVYSYHIMRLRIYDKEVLHPEYLAYLFSSDTVRKQIRIKAQGITRFGLTLPRWKSIQIPVPPLSVQQEIVRILDKFTQLEAELEAELDCRKRQYEYYRDKLLTFNEVVGGAKTLIFSDLQWKTLGDLGAFYGGLTGKNKNDFSNGNAKFISYMNVFSNIATNFKVNDFVKIGESENQNTIQYGDILFTGSSESLEECGMSSVVNEEVKENVYLNSFCFGYRFHNSELFLPNFLKFLFRSEKIRKQIVKTANGVTRFNVSKKKMEKIQIPIPPIEEQERIAGILDKFDTLVNSISEGLPREIELRRKQYEYYREKLLSFPKN